MKRFLISFGVAFLIVLCGYLRQTLPIYLDFVAHQPGKVPPGQLDNISPNTAFIMGSLLWIPALFCITAAVWTILTLLRRDRTNPTFPVRLLIVFLLCIASIPTLVVMADFGNLEATEEEWDWVIGWSYLLVGPLLAALYLALRNFQRMPLLAIFTGLLVLFHFATTILDYGWVPRYVADFRFGFDESTGTVDLGIVPYLLFVAAVTVPFLIVFLIWRFWPKRSIRDAEPLVN